MSNAEEGEGLNCMEYEVLFLKSGLKTENWSLLGEAIICCIAQPGDTMHGCPMQKVNALIAWNMKSTVTEK